MNLQGIEQGFRNVLAKRNGHNANLDKELINREVYKGSSAVGLTNRYLPNTELAPFLEDILNEGGWDRIWD
jgi:hypothetical protein